MGLELNIALIVLAISFLEAKNNYKKFRTLNNEWAKMILEEYSLNTETKNTNEKNIPK